MGAIRRTGAILMGTSMMAALAAPMATAQAPVTPWAAKPNLTSAQFQKQFDALGKAGYRLTWVSGHAKGKTARYTGVWRKQDGAPYIAKAGLSAGAYQKEFNTHTKAGFRLVLVNGFEVGGKDRYAAIWEKKTGPAYVARHGLSKSQYATLFKDLTGKGFRLTHVSGYSKGGSARFAAIFEQATGPAGIHHPAMSPAEYQGKFTEYSSQGFRIKVVSGYRDNGKDRYAAIWEKDGGPVRKARHGVKAASMQRAFDTDRYQGYVPVQLQGFSSGSDVRYTMIGESPFRGQDLTDIETSFNNALTTMKVAGMSVAVTKDGRLLYASGFGKADTEKGVAMDVHHRLRIGSTSKTITAVAIQRLIDQGRLRNGLDTKVFGQGGVLSSVDVPPAMAALTGARIRHFLSHTSGLPGFESGRAVGDPTTCGDAKNPNNLEKRLALRMASYSESQTAMGNSPLLGAPGEFFNYSNFSFMVAEAVIERVTKLTYENYVRRYVFAPMGFARPRLFKVGEFDPAWGEAKSYVASGKPAPWSPESTCENEPPGVGAGGWSMSALDLIRYLEGVDGDGKRDLLKPQTHQSMLTWAPATKQSNPAQNANGWFTKDGTWCDVTRDVKQAHNGWLPGGLSDLAELDDGYGIAVILNQNSPTSCDRRGTEALVNLLSRVQWPAHDLFGG